MTFSPFKSKSVVSFLFIGLTLSVPAAFAQTMTITSGQGQVLLPGTASNLPLTVQVLNANGTPLPGAVVNFSVSDLNNGYVPASLVNVTTDNNGMAASGYVGATLTPGISASYDTATITATYGGLSKTFYETTTNLVQGGTAAAIGPNFVNVNALLPLVGQSGNTGTPFSVLVTTSGTNFFTTGVGVPYVAVSLVLGGSGSISCQNAITAPNGYSYILTDQTGTATCTPVFGAIGSGYFTVDIGGGFVDSIQPIQFTVNVGPPAIIMKTSGDNQTGTPGQQLSMVLGATVTDAGGNPTPNIPMTFTISPSNGATLTNQRNVTDSNGKISANVVLGNVSGAVTITLVDTAGQIKSPAVFTETVNLAVTGITAASGNGQSTFINTAFPNPLVVQVGTSGPSKSGAPVTFAVTSGSATVGTASTTTDSNGNAQTTVTAGGTAGPVVVTATSGTFSTTFNLTVNPPGPSNLTFVNGASALAGSLSPGTIATIYGSGLANNLQGVASAYAVGPLPLQLAGVTVQFGGVYAPIFSVANQGGSQSVTVEVPRETAAGSTNVTIALAGGGSTTVPVTILAASPGIFTYTPNATNSQYAVVIKQNGTVAGPTNAANRGETVTMYVTGLPLTPAIGTNSFLASGTAVSSAYPIILGLANQGIPYNSVAYSPDLQGVETINFTIPTTVTPGALVVALGVSAPSGVAYSQGATLNVQ